MTASDIVIVGGGAIGLTIAFSLAQKGASVTVMDSNETGQASTASAGMLAPLGESKQSSPFVPLAVEALKRWPVFVTSLQNQIDTQLKINGPGMLRIALNADEEKELCATYEWQQTLGLPLKMLCPHELSDYEPGLSRQVRCAILTPMELHIEPKLLLAALTKACLRMGVKIVNNVKVTSFVKSGESVIGLKTAGSIYTCSTFVVAAGSWSALLLRDLGYRLPVRPIRGQIVSYTPITPSPLKHTIYSHVGYLVPRPDGSLLAGSTMEDVGFDASTTDEGITSLVEMARNLLPALRNNKAYTTWAGLRPVSDDSMALLGDVPGWQNVVLATGHGRNGILLAPYTGDLVSDYLMNNVPIPDMFNPGRFSNQR